MKRHYIFAFFLALAVLLPFGQSLAQGSLVEVIPLEVALVPGKCTFCEGSKRCQDCYPAGSKKNYAGEDCYTCSASGNCSYCGATGKCHLCGGHGFQTGCNNCTKVPK